MATRPQREYSLSDYHRIEEASVIRREFCAGEIFAMTGGSVSHNHVCANVLARLRTALADGPCSAFGSDMRLQTPAGLLTYPDAMVICGRIQLVPGRADEVTNPVLLVEVLSQATRRYERSEKFDFYRAIPSLREYVLIEPEVAAVEVRRRTVDSNWTTQGYSTMDDIVPIECLPLELPMTEIYRKVAL
ncbi:MAG TPA: Uma2 family endonuclease [Terriglobales bacterium]|nr:Uma2 family endonuclease [Terriglobales bacterium]